MLQNLRDQDVGVVENAQMLLQVFHRQQDRAKLCSRIRVADINRLEDFHRVAQALARNPHLVQFVHIVRIIETRFVGQHLVQAFRNQPGRIGKNRLARIDFRA